jgi:hypothetical protein
MLIPIILLVDKMPAGFAMGGILVMVTEPAPRADDLLFRCHVYPLLDHPAYLPEDKNDPREDHEYRNPFPSLGQGDDVTKTHGGKGHDREIEGIPETPHTGIDVALHIEKETRRDEKYHEYGQKEPDHLQHLHGDAAEEENRICSKP